MLYEYLLLSVVIACGYWGWFFVSRQPTGTPMFGVMQLGAAGLAGLGLLGRWKYEEDLLGVAGAIGLGRRAVPAGGRARSSGGRRGSWRRRSGWERRRGCSMWLRFWRRGRAWRRRRRCSARCARFAMGGSSRRWMRWKRPRSGRRRRRRLAIDERIALLYLAAYRWKEAIAHAETHLFGAAIEAAAGASVEGRASVRRAARQRASGTRRRDADAERGRSGGSGSGGGGGADGDVPAEAGRSAPGGADSGAEEGEAEVARRGVCRGSRLAAARARLGARRCGSSFSAHMAAPAIWIVRRSCWRASRTCALAATTRRCGSTARA